MHKEQMRQITKSHLSDRIDECRWCFAVDMERVKGNEIARYDFPDSTLLHFSCPRCGGEFSLYIPGWGEGYIKKVIRKFHPEIGGEIGEELLREVNDRVLCVDQLGNYLGF